MEGMAYNELGEEDMTAEWWGILEGMIESEKEHIPDLADYLSELAANIKPIDAAWPRVRARVDLWVGRWQDAKNTATLLTAEPEDKFIWIYGDTEHCETCRALHGLVAYASEWNQSGFYTQSPPNPLLSCGGWNCHCDLLPTTTRRSPRVLDRLLDLAASGT